MVEILKQNQNETLPVEKQIAFIFLGTQGFLDEVPVKKIRQLEGEFFQFLETRYPHILTDIAENKVLDEKIESALLAACKEFISIFSPEQ